MGSILAVLTVARHSVPRLRAVPVRRDHARTERCLLRVNRSLTAGLTLGALTAVVAIATFAIVQALTPNDLGWFA